MLISSSAIITRKSDNKVFIAKRSLNKEFSPCKWETIGGRAEKGESPEECLKREVKEEINIELKTFKPFKDYSYDGRVFKTFIVELGKEPNPNKIDFEDWGWFSKEEIEKMDFAINCKERIIDYYNQKNNNNNFEICARAIIQNNGKILVCYEKGNNYYFTPGGHVEFGESAEEALRRELKEELNISIKKCSFIGAVENVFIQNGENHHELDLVFNVEAENVSDKSEEDHIDFLFMDIDRFFKEKILPVALQKSLPKWLKDKKMFWASQIYDKSILY